jgi:hypothetical protein
MKYTLWQAQYAKHGIATFPVNEEKKPLVSNYQKVGIKGAAKIAEKFCDAPGIGFMAGERSRITVIDIDERGEPPLIKAIERFGDTPLIERTASGKHHLYYRHNGELRSIRPESGVEIDILGGGVIIAPWSEREGGRAEFVSGSLKDFAKLPLARNIPEGAKLVIVPDDHVPVEADKLITAPRGRRNRELWEYCMRQAKACETFDALLIEARKANAGLSEPLTDSEVIGRAASAWQYEQEERNFFGQGPGAWFSATEGMQLFKEISGDAILLLLFLRLANKPTSTFLIANGMAAIVGLSRERLQAARRELLANGTIRCVRRPISNSPALYKWAQIVNPRTATTGLPPGGEEAAGASVIEDR